MGFLLSMAVSRAFADYVISLPSEILGHGALSIGQANAVSVEQVSVTLLFRETWCEVSAEYRLFNYGKTLVLPLRIPLYSFDGGLKSFTGFLSWTVSIDGIKIPSGKLFFHTGDAPGDIAGYVQFSSDKPPLITVSDYTFELKLPEKQLSVVKLAYKIPLFYEIYGDKLHPLSTIYGPLQFLMDFRAMQSFGDGTIGELRILADARGLMDKSALLLQTILPEETSYSSWTGVFSYTATNLTAANTLPLCLSWDMSGYFNAAYILENRLPYKAVKKCVASSIMKTEKSKEFSLVYLFDNRFETSWSEGKKGTGEGEWIEITLAKGYLLSGIAAAAGYLRTDDTYYNNAVPVKLHIELIFPGGKKKTVVTELPKLPYNNSGFFGHIRKIAELDGMERVDKIKITILEAAPGKKYENTCISELYLIGGGKE